MKEADRCSENDFNACGGHGICTPSFNGDGEDHLCSCFYPFYGENCQLKDPTIDEKCIGDCGDHEECFLLDGNPECGPGIGFLSNGQPSCTGITCGGHGTCNVATDGIMCTCDSGWEGDLCQLESTLCNE